MATDIDRAMDEAEQLAANRILNDPTEETILEAVREIVGLNFHSHSRIAGCALAAYNRVEQNIMLLERLDAENFRRDS